MKLSEEQFAELYEVAKQAALKAGKVVSEYPREDLKVNKKEGGASLASQVVTEVDLLSEKEVTSALKPSREKYDIALLSEETEDDNSRFKKDYFWCTDPIDGTLPFIEGIPGYAVCISLIGKDGTSHIGIIYDPYNGNLYHALKGHGAFKNDRPFKIDHDKEKDIFYFINDRSIKKYERYEELLRKMEKFSQVAGYKEFKTILTGGAAMNTCWMIEKAHGCYFKIPRPINAGGSIWDFAASACIVQEAGGVASDFYENPLDLNRTDSTYMNHKGAIFASSEEVSKYIQQL
ncbi:MAG: hypothetical protein NE328_21735 [Lentisphaeraceae bacterium]|nr:hypothetical protein [Lentisphaeraceae bacterium]